MPHVLAQRREDRPEVMNLVIDNRAALNALTTSMQVELIEHLRALKGDKSVRVVVLRGAGTRAFSSGGSMDSLSELATDEARMAMYQRGCDIRSAIEALEQPIIAAVSGYCIGGGFEIAMSCDIIYASDDARFGLPESNIGLIPGWGGAIRLPRKLTVNKAKEMLFLGEQMSADEAHRLFIVNKVFPREDLFSSVDHIVDRLLSRAPLAIRGVKAIVSHAVVDGNIEAAHEVEKNLAIYLMSTDDFHEAVQAFTEKRPPNFKGK